MATLAEIRNRVLSKLDDGSIQRPTSAQVTDQINSVIDYYNNHKFWFSEAVATLTTTANNPVLSLASITDFKSFQQQNAITIVDSNTRFPLKQVDPVYYDSVNSTATGRPTMFTYRNGQVNLYYYPDKAYTTFVYYKKTYANLVNDSDTNDFTNYAARLIEYKTLADCLRDYRSDFERSAVYEAQAQKELTTVQAESYDRSATGMLATENVVEYGAGWYTYQI